MARAFLLFYVAAVIAANVNGRDNPPKDEVFWVDINPKNADQPRFKTYLHEPPKGVNAQCTLLITAAQWRQDLLVASYEGVNLLSMPAGKWTKRHLGVGNQDNPKSNRGSSEIKYGKLKSGQRFIAGSSGLRASSNWLS